MIEKLILSNLVYNEPYARACIAFLKQDYFENSFKNVYTLIDDYIKKYNTIPTKEVLFIDLDNNLQLNENDYKQTKQLISELETDEHNKLDWLVDHTEKFCQDKALYNAIRQSIKIIDEPNSQQKGIIPKLVQDALQVSFDSSIGHDFIEDYSSRYDLYHKAEARLDFDLDYFNKITNGGIPQKSLNLILSSTGVGKTLVMCHMAAYNLICSKNVLYITLEMAEERIAQRIDTNLLNIPLDDLMMLSKKDYEQKISKLKQTTKGKLIIKEYPTAAANSNHFRHLLNELRIKKNFVPDIIYVDYLNLCLSARIKSNANANTYTYIKAVTEEIRGLAVEFNLPIVSATQLNRDAQGSSDVGIENTSDSLGIAMTADFMVALISTEELQELNQIMVKQLKNRYGDPSMNRRFVIGVDRSKMKLYNVASSEQDNLIDRPVMDNTKFGMEDNERSKPAMKFDKSKFKGFR